MSSFTYKQTGIQATIDRLLAFDKKFKKSAMLKIGRAGVKPLKAAMRKNAPVQSGTWRNSLDSKIKTFNEGRVLFFVVGPNSKYVAVVTITPPEGTRLHTTRDGRPAAIWRDKQGRIRVMPLTQKRRPVNYSHLIEDGTVHSKAHHMIARSEAESRTASAAAMEAVAGAIMETI